MKRLSTCNEPGCPELTLGARCPAHEGAERAVDWRVAVRKVYASKRWRGRRRQVRREQPWCATPRCTNPTTDTDHIEPLQDVLARDGDPYDRANLQGLCKPCHSAKTASELWGRK